MCILRSATRLSFPCRVVALERIESKSSGMTSSCFLASDLIHWDHPTFGGVEKVRQANQFIGHAPVLCLASPASEFDVPAQYLIHLASTPGPHSVEPISASLPEMDKVIASLCVFELNMPMVLEMAFSWIYYTPDFHCTFKARRPPFKPCPGSESFHETLGSVDIY